MLLQLGGLRLPLPDLVWKITSSRGLSGRGICEGSMRLPETGDTGEPPGPFRLLVLEEGVGGAPKPLG